MDAWDRELADTDYDGNPYPADVDVNNDGIIFYIMPGGSYDTDHPVSLREYKSWYDSILGGAPSLRCPSRTSRRTISVEYSDGHA